jgi:hypothetical protein
MEEKPMSEPRALRKPVDPEDELFRSRLTPENSEKVRRWSVDFGLSGTNIVNQILSNVQFIEIGTVITFKPGAQIAPGNGTAPKKLRRQVRFQIKL